MLCCIAWLFVLFMFWGVIMSFSSWSYWGAWLGMELTTMFFIPYLSQSKMYLFGYTLWEYFVVQALGSSVFILGMVSMPQVGIMHYVDMGNVFGLLSVGAILLKLGMPPFHWWSLIFCEFLGWKEFWMFSSLVKLAPMTILLNYVAVYGGTIVVVLQTLMLLLGVQGSIDLSIRRILIYSSMVSLMWVIAGVMVSLPSSIVLLFSYMTILACVCAKFHSSNVYSMLSITRLFSSMSSLGVFIWLVLIWSLMGFPPSIMFMVKLDILMMLWSSVSPYLTLFLAFLGIVMLAGYLNLMSKAIISIDSYTPSYQQHVFYSCYVIVILATLTMLWMY
nr:NADH dehydrogenase subunit 2 [Haematopinus suis]